MPNYDGMSVAEAHEAKQTYLTQRKKFRDGLRWERLQAGKGSAFVDNDYSGDLTPTLRTMTAVSLSRLKLGQNFPERDIITLRIAEEANYRGISFHTDKSDAMKMYCRGPGSFLVYATNSDTCGWTITRCQVLEENEEHNMAVSSPTVPPTNTKLPRSPYKAATLWMPSFSLMPPSRLPALCSSPS